MQKETCQESQFSKNDQTAIPKTNSKWTAEQDLFLLEIINNVGCKWKFISRYFPEKTIFQLYSRYLKIDPNIKRGRFTADEDKKIQELVALHGSNWAKIAKLVKNRSSKQIRYRYKNHLSKNYDESELSEDEKRIIFLNYPILGNKWNCYTNLLAKNRSPSFIRKVVFKS